MALLDCVGMARTWRACRAEQWLLLSCGVERLRFWAQESYPLPDIGVEDIDRGEHLPFTTLRDIDLADDLGGPHSLQQIGSGEYLPLHRLRAVILSLKVIWNGIQKLMERIITPLCLVKSVINILKMSMF